MLTRSGDERLARTPHRNVLKAEAIINDGQLDDCPLTLRELAIVKDTFSTTLRSMLHSRIDYPKDDERPSTATKRAVNDATQGGRVIPMPKRA